MTFNRGPEPGLVHVIGLQTSESDDRFTVNVGVYVREIDLSLNDGWHRQHKTGEPGQDGAGNR